MQAFTLSAAATSSGLRSDSGPLMCPQVPGLLLLLPCPAPRSPAGRRRPCGFSAQLNSGKPCVVKLLLPQNNSSDRVWVASSILFCRNRWYFIAIQRCPEAVYIMFFKQDFIPVNFCVLSDRGLGPCAPEPPPEKVPAFACQPRAQRSQLQRGASFPRLACWGLGHEGAEVLPLPALSPVQLGPSRDAAGSQVDWAHKVQGPSGPQRLGGLSLISQAFPPLRPSSAQSSPPSLRAGPPALRPLLSHSLIPWASQPPGCRTLAY